MAYTYTPEQLENWSQQAANAALNEQLQHQQARTAYWQHRALSAERRMLEHTCEPEQEA